jgi:hypothetical protein
MRTSTTGVTDVFNHDDGMSSETGNLALVGPGDSIYSVFQSDLGEGFTAHVTDATGNIEWTLIRLETDANYIFGEGVDVEDMAVDSSGRVAFVGDYWGFGPGPGPGSIVQVFTPK